MAVLEPWAQAWWHLPRRSWQSTVLFTKFEPAERRSLGFFPVLDPCVPLWTILVLPVWKFSAAGQQTDVSSFVLVLTHKFRNVYVSLRFPAAQLFVFTQLFGSLKCPQRDPRLALQNVFSLQGAAVTSEMDSEPCSWCGSVGLSSLARFVAELMQFVRLLGIRAATPRVPRPRGQPDSGWGDISGCTKKQNLSFLIFFPTR